VTGWDRWDRRALGAFGQMYRCYADDWSRGLYARCFVSSSALLKIAAPNIVTAIPAPLSRSTVTLNKKMPSKTVKHCFRLPQTVIVKAPASLFVLNEEIFRRKARQPLPARDAIAEGSEMSADVTRSRKRPTSPVAAAQARACRAARGDIRRINSSGGRAKVPVMNRLVTTVWLG